MKLSRIDDEELDEEMEEPIDDTKYQDDDLFKEDLGWDMDGLGGGYKPMEKHNDLLKELTNFDGFLKDAVNGWLGLTWKQEEGKFVADPFIKPIMNTSGAAWCVSFIKNYARKNNIITNLNVSEYNFIIADVIDTVWLNIPVRMEEFGINNNGDALRICNELEHITRLVLTGAGDGKYNKLLTETTTRNESLTMQQQPQYPQMQMQPKQSMLGKVKNFLTSKS